jgi:hypothetical protein
MDPVGASRGLCERWKTSSGRNEGLFLLSSLSLLFLDKEARGNTVYYIEWTSSGSQSENEVLHFLSLAGNSLNLARLLPFRKTHR